MITSSLLLTAYNNAVRTGNKVSAQESRELIAIASRDQYEGPAALGELLHFHPRRFTAPATRNIEAYLSGSSEQPANTWVGKAEHSVWSTTYFPYSNFMATAAGDPLSNLWADRGPLAKFDKLLAARGKATGAQAWEKRPALGYLVGEESGFFIPSGTLDEKDAEKTCGVDFDGDNKLKKNFKRDFLTAFGDFGTDGKTTKTMDVSWWGSCDKVTRAGMLFQEPKRDVTLNGVTFTVHDIRGLLTLIADAQLGGTEFVGNRYDGKKDVVRLRNGEQYIGDITSHDVRDFRSGAFKRSGDVITRSNLDKAVTIETEDGPKTFAASKVLWISREEQHDPSPALFEATVRRWLGDRRPFAMDHDAGSHVWNDNYDGARISEIAGSSASLNGENGNYTAAQGQLRFYEAKLLKGDTVSQTYRYWIARDGDRVTNSGWLTDSPDFMWRPNGRFEFADRNARNPYVDPKLVLEIYQRSIAT